MESLKAMPFGLVWDEYCARQEVPVGTAYMDEIKAYERTELAKR
jgi:L-rhamnose isomerase